MSFKSEAQIVFQNGLDKGQAIPDNSSATMEPGSGGNNGGSANAGSGNSNEMPGMPGMMGMGGMPMMPGYGGGMGMAPNDSRLAEEFVKLQQDFFKWQQQLLQNQHVLHSRVAPLASNPPQLQSVGVMRDIMSQAPTQDGSSAGYMQARNPTAEAQAAPAVPTGPVERIIPIKMECTTTTTTTVRENELRPSSNVSSTQRLSQSMQDVSLDPSQPSVNSFSRTTYVQPPRRWGEEPNVSVGAWSERPSQPIGVYHDQDYVTSAPRSRSTHDLSSAPPSSEQQRPGVFQTPRLNPQQQSQPQQPQPQPQQLYSLPPHQQQQFAQFLQQQMKQQQPQQQPPEPDKGTFWRELESQRQNFGLQQDPGVPQPEPMRPPRRNSRQDSPPQESDFQKPLTYFGQEVVVQEPPQTYYYNGDGPKTANSGPGMRPKTIESEIGGPRFTSVVNLSSEKGPELSAGEPQGRDTMRSVVQLNNTDNQRSGGMPRVTPVVRGFRQPGEETSNQGNSFHSKIISNAGRGRSSVSPPFVAQTSSVPEAPTAARLVSAVSAQPPAKAPSPSMAQPFSSNRVSPPRTANARVSPARTSPSRASPSSGPAFGNVQLRPVPGGLRSSPPSDLAQQMPPPPPPSAPIPPPAPVSQMGNIPPPPPPAPPMAPPPPPPPVPSVADGERRTSSGKRIVSAKTGPELDAREELMMAIKNHGGLRSLKKTRNYGDYSEA